MRPMRRRKCPQKLTQLHLNPLQNLLRNQRQNPLPSLLRHLPLMRLLPCACARLSHGFPYGLALCLRAWMKRATCCGSVCSSCCAPLMPRRPKRRTLCVIFRNGSPAWVIGRWRNSVLNCSTVWLSRLIWKTKRTSAIACFSRSVRAFRAPASSFPRGWTHCLPGMANWTTPSGKSWKNFLSWPILATSLPLNWWNA